VSFRGRLLVFFTIIVIIPMVAVALVLFSLTKGSETGKSDARIAEGLQTALTVYDDARDDAGRGLRRVVSDPVLRRGLAGGQDARVGRRIRALARADRSIESIVLYDARDREVTSAGSRSGIAYATAAPTTPAGRPMGTLAVSVTSARRFAADVAHLTALEVRLQRGGRLLASTLRESRPADVGGSGDVKIEGQSYRGRVEDVREGAGPALTIGLLDEAEGVTSSIAASRYLIGGILLAFLVLALASSVVVVRALQGQVSQFLGAARRLGEGDFTKPVPIQGEDEFAALGSEFNKMSEQLAGKIEEVEGKRRELEGAIHRVGAAFAAGLDRQGIVELAIATAVDACAAEAGRALPLDGRKLKAKEVGGADEPELAAGLEAAEREAFRIRIDDGSHRWRAEGAEPPDPRRLTHASVDGVHALAIPLRARLGADEQPEDVGVVSIARRGDEFGDSEGELFAYLAVQAAVSIENADLHETVQLQAVTDGLTGLFNVRRFHETLDGEIERSRRFGNEVGLIMLDIDDFKKINDSYGHQQGDLVLVEVARTLLEHSRDIDEPARYGGEEMAVILPGTDLGGAELLAERMRAAIDQLEINRLGGEGSLSVTASFGVSSLPEAAADKDGLIAAADSALYRAKRAGKNRVERAERARARR
jgi:diguanylate cyclase (GGDEF)-like protein